MGTVKPGDFLFKNLVLTIFRDLNGDGYQRVLDEYEFGFHMFNKSFQHNAQQIRFLLKSWARSNIKIFSEKEWNEGLCFYNFFHV